MEIVNLQLRNVKHTIRNISGVIIYSFMCYLHVEYVLAHTNLSEKK